MAQSKDEAMEQDTPVLVQTPQDGIRIIKLNRPDRLNALTREMVQQVNETPDAIAADSSVRVVILTGAGRGFCAGQDLQAAAARTRAAAGGGVEKLHWQDQFADMVRHIRALPVPVIAAVNGAAAGAGCALAFAADIRLAVPDAKFLIASVRIGLSAGETGISYNLPRLIGAARAFEILLTGRPIDAREAERFGLITRLVDEPGNLLAAAMEAATAILVNSPFAIAQTKQLMWANLDAASLDAALALENRAQILGTMTEDYTEATIAFTEKRPPVFNGR